jgi:omega-amidase
MKVAFLQFDICWEDINANLDYIEKSISGVQNCDLLILPEMFNTGYSMNARQNAENMSGSTVAFLKKQAERLNSGICGSVAIQENGYYYNRFLFSDEHGSLKFYDKRFLFTLAKENEIYKPGLEHKVFSYRSWRICPQICYDLRFPEWQRAALPFDLLIFVASWPEKRKEAWKKLLVARAIENQCYVIGVNRIGTDGNGLRYEGDSLIVDFEGNIITDAHNEEGIFSSLLDMEAMTEFRLKFNFLSDKHRITFD